MHVLLGEILQSFVYFVTPCLLPRWRSQMLNLDCDISCEIMAHLPYFHILTSSQKPPVGAWSFFLCQSIV